MGFPKSADSGYIAGTTVKVSLEAVPSELSSA
jgi:hypothetical protein